MIIGDPLRRLGGAALLLAAAATTAGHSLRIRARWSGTIARGRGSRCRAAIIGPGMTNMARNRPSAIIDPARGSRSAAGIPAATLRMAIS
jgi:hypothetical protein